jgi:hypothetical protein
MSAFNKMAIDESALAQNYNLITLSVTSSTQISNRAVAVIEKLQATSNDDRPDLLVLRSKARTVSKLISIVEIAKRELAKTGHKCFQYNALSSEMIEIERNPKQGANGSKDGAADANESESDDAFETMGTGPKTGTKKRLVPVMTTYLCATSVKELNNAYG